MKNTLVFIIVVIAMAISANPQQESRRSGTKPNHVKTRSSIMYDLGDHFLKVDNVVNFTMGEVQTRLIDVPDFIGYCDVRIDTLALKSGDVRIVYTFCSEYKNVFATDNSGIVEF